MVRVIAVIPASHGSNFPLNSMKRFGLANSKSERIDEHLRAAAQLLSRIVMQKRGHSISDSPEAKR
jgi:hypothetical protein